ncbi:unnamed protein product [Spirodela intermedia]|uniref:Uncharacterized protein n=1 Tax=Spirodela intermedia TaxID=51605 RepID=A0A7I8L6T0_SPIIN|nr:unnamed protein product [Spirodela intermedia]
MTSSSSSPLPFLILVVVYTHQIWSIPSSPSY